MEIRVASADEFDELREMVEVADRLFESVGIGPFSGSAEDDHFESAAVVLVAGSPAVGVACVDVVDGEAHLWQLSVHPSAGRKGVGTALVEAVCRWAAGEGYPAVTLTTFRDVAWNGPFYARLGFVPVDDLPPGLAAIRQHEVEIGDDAFGPRLAMRKELEARP